nr:ABC transporter [Streptomyces sp. HNM0574]
MVRYQLALLLRSQRWLPPLLLYAALLAVGVQPGQPLLDGFGYAAAMLLPVAAWTARVCVTGEPEAARHCAAAAAGPRRAHLGALLAALAASLVLGLAGTLYAALSGEPHSTGGAVAVPPLASAGAGLSATVTCALTGTAVGALCARPLVRGTGRAVPALLAGVLLALVNPASPANAAVRALTAGSREGTVPAPWLPLALSALLAAAACAVTAWLAPRRDPTSAG